jgi:hypothetical protein
LAHQLGGWRVVEEGIGAVGVTRKRESLQLRKAADDGGLCSKSDSYRGSFGRELAP